MKLRIKVGFRTVAGEEKTINEDALLVDKKNNFYAVADGVSEGGYGQYASKKAIEIARENPALSLDELIHKMRQNIIEGGTTFTGARIKKDRDDNYALEIAHIGDSKAFLVRDEISKQLTEDHCTEEGGLTQALGASYNGEIKPCYREIPLKLGDIVIIGSDGAFEDVNGKVDTEEMGKIAAAAKNPQKSCDTIINYSSREDDASVIVVRLEEESSRHGKAAMAAGILSFIAFGFLGYNYLSNRIVNSSEGQALVAPQLTDKRPDKTSQQPIAETRAITPTAAEERKPEETPAETKRAEETTPTFTLSERVNFRTRRIGPTSSILSRIRDFKVIESNEEHDVINFRINVGGNAENAYAFFDYDTKIIYKSEIKDGNAVFTVKRPKNVGRLNVIAAVGEDNAIRWTSSWKYSGIEEKINSELSKAKKSGKTEDGLYSPRNAIENMKKASNGYEIESRGKIYQTWMWNDRIEVMKTLAHELSQHELSDGDKAYIAGLADSIKNNEYLNEKIREGRIKRKKVYSLVNRLESLIHPQTGRTTFNNNHNKNHNIYHRSKINPNYKFLAKVGYHKQKRMI